MHYQTPPNLDFRPTAAATPPTTNPAPTLSPSAHSASSAISASPSALPARRINIPLPAFDPDPLAVESVLQAFLDPTETLVSIARHHRTTLQALTAWLATPDTAERLANFRNACTERTRTVAANYLPNVAFSCYNIIGEFNNDQQHMSFYPKCGQDHEIKRRNRDTARKSGLLLFRLATHGTLPNPDHNVEPKRSDPNQPPRADAPEAQAKPRASDEPEAQARVGALDEPEAQAREVTPTTHEPQASQATEEGATGISHARDVATSTPNLDARAPVSTPLADKLPVPPAPASPTSAIPHPKSDIPGRLVPLTISARSLIQAAGQPRPRAP